MFASAFIDPFLAIALDEILRVEESREATFSSRLDKDLKKALSYRDQEITYENLITHVDVMHSLIHKAKEGLTSNNNQEEGLQALKAITAMQSYIIWDK